MRSILLSYILDIEEYVVLMFGWLVGPVSVQCIRYKCMENVTSIVLLSVLFSLSIFFSSMINIQSWFQCQYMTILYGRILTGDGSAVRGCTCNRSEMVRKYPHTGKRAMKCRWNWQRWDKRWIVATAAGAQFTTQFELHKNTQNCSIIRSGTYFCTFFSLFLLCCCLLLCRSTLLKMFLLVLFELLHVQCSHPWRRADVSFFLWLLFCFV